MIFLVIPDSSWGGHKRGEDQGDGGRGAAQEATNRRRTFQLLTRKFANGVG